MTLRGVTGAVVAALLLLATAHSEGQCGVESDSNELTDMAAEKGRVLVTGGTGFIGSHTCVQLLEAGYQVTIIDNLCNSRYAAILAFLGAPRRFHGIIC